jgi:hypothetical protein
MKAFLRRFGAIVLGILSGFDRLVLRGKLCPLYAPEGMNIYLQANGVLRKDFEKHAKEMTAKVLQASLIEHAKKFDRFAYLNSSNIDKDNVARGYAKKHGIRQGLVCVLQCVEPCWSYELVSKDHVLTVQGKQRKCSHLYHYYLDPRFGWMYVRLQTWFPFEMQVYVNGREWLARQMDREGLKYRRSDNKILWVENWRRAKELLNEQLQTSWPSVLDAYQGEVHPLHPEFLGQFSSLRYNWTVHQSEWASDVVFASRRELTKWMKLWQRQALDYASTDVLRFLGRRGRVQGLGDWDVETEYKQRYEGCCIKHWVGKNSLKLYDHLNVGRIETTINDVEFFKVFRASQADPEGDKDWRAMRRTVADLHRRAEVSQAVNERYLTSLAATKETRTVRELVEPLCQPAKEPGKKKTQRKVRALNPWSPEDALLLRTIADPKWMVVGIRNRDVVAALYKEEAKDIDEKRRRSARATRLLRILRGHGLLQKVPRSHRYQVNETARFALTALLSASSATPEKLSASAA